MPLAIQAAGDSAKFAWEEFFYAKIRSEHTRRAYMRAVRFFLHWCELQAIGLTQISPAHVGLYLDRIHLATASKKQILAALRQFFDGMVTRHAIVLNPALSVRTERYTVVEGKTPEITVKQARLLLQSIDTTNSIGLRDKSIISILIYTAARIGAVSQLRICDLYDAGDQYCLHFVDKGGKSREIPVRHDLQRLLFDLLKERNQGRIDHSDLPLFTTFAGRTQVPTIRAMTANDIGRMVKRRMAAAGLPSRLSPHSFRVEQRLRTC
jgi:site-specific recombinase XerD